MDTKSTNALQATQMPTVTIAGDVTRDDHRKRNTLAALCYALDKRPEEIQALFECNPHRIKDLEEKCARLEGIIDTLKSNSGSCTGKCSSIDRRCDGLWNLCFEQLCPGSVPFSRYTMDEKSQENHILLNEIVKVEGDPNNVDSYPVTPLKYIRLTHPKRPGFVPKNINIDLHLANGGNNYLDIEVEFYLVSGGVGKKVGVTYQGNNFLNKDGTQIVVAWPEYKGRRIEVGYAEHVVVVLRHIGAANNLLSANVRLTHDLKEWYALCKHWGYGDCVPSPC